jgi:hypothetical protein
VLKCRILNTRKYLDTKPYTHQVYQYKPQYRHYPSKSPKSLSLRVRSVLHSPEIRTWDNKIPQYHPRRRHHKANSYPGSSFPPQTHYKPFERSELPHQHQQTTPDPIASPRHTLAESQPATPESCPSPQRLQWCDDCAVAGPVCLISPVARRVAKGSDEESRAGDGDGWRLVEPAG